MADMPVVLVTGAAGDIGSRLVKALSRDDQVVGMDRPGMKAEVPLLDADLADQASIERALDGFARRWGPRIASVIHLAAYFDTSGDDNPLYDKVNVGGTRALLPVVREFARHGWGLGPAGPWPRRAGGSARRGRATGRPGAGPVRDVADEAQVEAAAGQVERRWGRIDV